MTAPVPVSPLWGLGKGGVTPVAGSVGSIPYPPDVAQHIENIGRQLSVPLPEVYPIPDAHVFNAEGQVASPGAQQNINIPLLPLVQIPTGNLGVMTSFSIYVQNMLATTNITWTLLANGVAVQGYTGITIFPGVSPRAANTFDIPVRFTGEQNLTIVFTNTDGGAYLIGAAISGWFWPTSSDRRWKSAGPVDVG